jgi:hypothetical protein
VAQEPESRTVNARNVKILAVVVVALFVAMFILNSADRDDSAADSELLFPELKTRLNDLNSVAITDADGTITLQRESDGGSDGGRWISPDHAGYPADTGHLRQLLLALAEARKLERKTSDPQLYDRLGVDDPRNDGGDGILVSANGRDVAVSVILGSTAQEFRYARIPDDEQSWLIDRNPVIPDDGAGWLLADIVDVESSRIRSASIRHADGEVTNITKEDEDAVNFEVAEIPEGRELRYPSVANSIAGVLSNLTLEAVRKDDTAGKKPLATAEFSTFDGLDLRIAVHAVTAPGEAQADESETAGQDEEHWITVSAAASPTTAGAEDAPEDRDAEAAPAETEVDPGNGPDGDEEALEPGEQPAENVEHDTPAEQERNPADEAGRINERVSGWTYRIPTYKADQLTRRWDDLLSDVDDGDEVD